MLGSSRGRRRAGRVRPGGTSMKTIGIAAGALALAGFAQTAAAQSVVEREMVPAPMTAPRGALEINVDTGYTQGFGTVYGGRGMRDIAEAGVGVGIGIGYRALPTFSIAATGQFQGFNASNDLPKGTQVRGGTAGIEATFHVAPFERADPWLSLGTGYRMLWEVPGGRRPVDAHARLRDRKAGGRRGPQALRERRPLADDRRRRERLRLAERAGHGDDRARRVAP